MDDYALMSDIQQLQNKQIEIFDRINKYFVSIENLCSIHEVIERYGKDDTLMYLMNSEEQLSNYINVDTMDTAEVYLEGIIGVIKSIILGLYDFFKSIFTTIDEIFESSYYLVTGKFDKLKKMSDIDIRSKEEFDHIMTEKFIYYNKDYTYDQYVKLYKLIESNTKKMAESCSTELLEKYISTFSKEFEGLQCKLLASGRISVKAFFTRGPFQLKDTNYYNKYKSSIKDNTLAKVIEKEISDFEQKNKMYGVLYSKFKIHTKKLLDDLKKENDVSKIKLQTSDVKKWGQHISGLICTYSNMKICELLDIDNTLTRMSRELKKYRKKHGDPS